MMHHFRQALRNILEGGRQNLSKVDIFGNEIYN